MKLIITKKMQKDWHARVYAKDEDQHPLPAHWEVLRETILLRDRYKCKICQSKENLTVHHRVPRADGGSDEADNLETVCEKCHNIVELEYKNESRTINSKSASKTDDWHEWVYGGARNPKL